MSRADASPWRGLTRREIQVAELVCAGFRRRQIAERLGVELQTFDTHRIRVLHKLGVSNEVALLRLAITEGWVTL